MSVLHVRPYKAKCSPFCFIYIHIYIYFFSFFSWMCLLHRYSLPSSLGYGGAWLAAWVCLHSVKGGKWPQVSCVGKAQVLCCYCEGRKTSSMDALLVNVWNMIPWARAPVGGSAPLAPPPPHNSFILPNTCNCSYFSLPQCSVHMRFYVRRTQTSYRLQRRVKGNWLCANGVIMLL